MKRFWEKIRIFRYNYYVVYYFKHAEGEGCGGMAFAAKKRIREKEDIDTITEEVVRANKFRHVVLTGVFYLGRSLRLPTWIASALKVSRTSARNATVGRN